jgi:hypothetical protein
MEHLKQKKKPAVKLEQIIIPDKEIYTTAKPDTPKLQFTQHVSAVFTGIESPTKCNSTGVSGTAESQLLVHSLLSVPEREERVMDSHNSVRVYDKSAPHGTEPAISESIPIVKQLKKRGRKRKIPIDEKYTNTEYLVMWPEICMAQKVLVDRYDNVYTYDLTNPVWLGVKTVYGKIDNVTYSAPLTKYYFQ